MKNINSFRWTNWASAAFFAAYGILFVWQSSGRTGFSVILKLGSSVTPIVLANLLIDAIIVFVAHLRRREGIKKAPGSRLMSIVTFLFSSADVEKIFKPTLADWHREYFEALAARQFWKGRWINVRYRYRFAAAMGLSRAWKVIDAAIKAVTSAISK